MQPQIICAFKMLRRLPRRSDIDMSFHIGLGCIPAGGHFAPAGEIHAPALRYASEMSRTRDRLLAPAPLPTVPTLSLHCPELHMYKKLLHHRMQQLFMLI